MSLIIIPYDTIYNYIYLYIYISVGVDIKTFLLPMGTFLLAFTFVFGNSLKNMWECVLFIFVIRPYEVGMFFTYLSIRSLSFLHS